MSDVRECPREGTITDDVPYPLMLDTFVNRENGTWCEQDEMRFRAG